MRTSYLINGVQLDLVSTRVSRASSVPVQRQLSTHAWLLRRKSDGKFLACTSLRGQCIEWTWLLRAGDQFQVEADALARVARRLQCSGPLPRQANASTLGGNVHRKRDRRLTDAIGRGYALRTGLDPVPEPAVLAYAATDRYRRPLWLDAPAAVAWARMRTAAAGGAVALEAISGFRSCEYQSGIFRRKLARGQSIEEILAVNAAPGFSEHHSGHAIDIGAPGEPPAEESFETTAAFAWLTEHAPRFGFTMSYPRGNPHGIAYEPWHWMWRPAKARHLQSLET